MSQELCCKCLNVKILIRNKNENYEPDIPSLQTLFPSGASSIEIEGGGGLTKTNRWLCTTIKVDDWLATKCWGCGLITHAVNPDASIVVVNNLLEVFSPTLQDQDPYSPLFKILVPALDTIKEVSSSYGKKHESLVQEMVNNFLLQEKKNMEERIRLYSEKQYCDYNNLQGQIRKDKFSILSLLENVEEPQVSSPVIPTIPTPVTEEVLQEQKETVPALNSSFQHCLSRTAYLKKHFVRKTRPQKNVSQLNKYASESDSYGVFHLDGMEIGDDSQWYSSDNDTDVESNTYAKEEVVNNARNKKAEEERYAKSLPIDVPFSVPIQYSDDDLDEPLIDPSEIAANMQALSLSLCEKVWDRPSRPLDIRGLIENHASLTNS